METDKIKKYLGEYAGLKKEVEKSLDRIARAKSNTQIPAMRESDGSQHQSGSGDRFEKSVIRFMDAKERLYPVIEEKVAHMRRIEAAIEEMRDPFEREVLRLRYLDADYGRLVPWKDVAMSLYGDDDENQKQATYRLHGRALQSLGRVLEEHEEYHVDL